MPPLFVILLVCYLGASTLLKNRVLGSILNVFQFSFKKDLALVAANEEVGYLKEAGKVDTYFTLHKNGRLDKGPWMHVPGTIQAGQPTERGHTWRLNILPTTSSAGTGGVLITLWNRGQDMFLAVTADHGLWLALHTSEPPCRHEENKKNTQWSVIFTFLGFYTVGAKR
jgi:hypothetical protein